MKRYPAIDEKLFIYNREKFSKSLKPNSLAVFHSNDLILTNADSTLAFRQNNDIFYLSGIDQEESILIIYPDSNNAHYKTILFLRETNENIAIWEGAKYTKQLAKETSGIETIHWLNQFDKIFEALMLEVEYVYLNTNEHNRAVVEVETRDARFIKKCKAQFPLHKYERSAPIMHLLRAIKHPIEIELLKKAISITEKSFRRILNFVKPGVMEFEVEAEYTHEFVRNRATHAYTPIIASGTNSCVLHYIDNNLSCNDGDLLLMDVGSSYANYASDMTRTIPVNGKFSVRQRLVYDAVLRVMKAATKMLVVGNIWDDYHKEVGKIMEIELIELGLLNKNEVDKQDPEKPLYKKYFMHGTSHFIGLDVHDVGNKYRKFEAGMVFTCEPGIYIKEENIGIRLENNILITETGNIDLMASIPLEADEIEELMKH